MVLLPTESRDQALRDRALNGFADGIEDALKVGRWIFQGFGVPPLIVFRGRRVTGDNFCAFYREMCRSEFPELHQLIARGMLMQRLDEWLKSKADGFVCGDLVQWREPDESERFGPGPFFIDRLELRQGRRVATLRDTEYRFIQEEGPDPEVRAMFFPTVLLIRVTANTPA